MLQEELKTFSWKNFSIITKTTAVPARPQMATQCTAQTLKK